jgi:hypothetical protein
MSIPVEITAAGILITFWDPDRKHQAYYTIALCICVCIINIFGVRSAKPFSSCEPVRNLTFRVPDILENPSSSSQSSKVSSPLKAE